MNIIGNSDPYEEERLKSLQIPDRYLFKVGVLNIKNWRFKKLPRGKGDPPSCIMRFLMQNICMGCEKLRFVLKVDVNDFEQFAAANPHLNPIQVETQLLDNYKQQFAHSLAYKYDMLERAKMNTRLLSKVGKGRLPSVKGRKRIG